MIKIIVATSKNGVIGKNNELIWKLPNDLKRFKQITINNSVVMGRKTFESIGKSLPNRRNIVITRQSDYTADNCEIVSSLEEALLLTNNDCFIIGGGEIYNQAIKVAEMIYLTLINDVFEGDTYFPNIGPEWIKIGQSDFESDDVNQYNYSFIEYVKKES